MPRSPVSACLLLALAACAGVAPGPTASLPRDAVDGIGDPARSAIIGSAHAFASDATLAGRPAAAAQVEYLAAKIPTGPRWMEWSPSIGMQLQGARAELRSALGIPAVSQPQAMVDALSAAAALAAAEAADRGTLLVRLSYLPPLPRTRTATALAERELIRVDQDQRLGGSGGNDGGKD